MIWTTEYDGSTILKPLAERIGVPIDQVNFFSCQLFALLVAFAYRRFLSPRKVSTELRHVVSIALGISMCYFCFGRNTTLVLLLPLIAYASLTLIFGASTATGVGCCFCVAFMYLSFLHLKRVFFNYESYVLDATGPLMIMVGKLTTLFFNLYDGKRFKSLTPEKRSQALTRCPDFLPYLSYLLHFQGILCGPMVPYAEYERFIQGKILTKQQQLKLSPAEEETVWKDVLRKVLQSVLCTISFVALEIFFPVSHIKEPAFYSRSLPSKLIYFFVVFAARRCMYYCAWLLGDAIINASGMGFAGYDSRSGLAKWDAFSNVKIWEFEMSLSLRDAIDVWNINTKNWLSYVCYSRIGYFPTLSTFMLSALWHGFYPGYYITFATAALMTTAARTVRRSVRHFFLGSPLMKLCYDFLTWLSCRIILTYIFVPFVLLDLASIHRVYSSVFYVFHIMALLIVFIFPCLFVQHRVTKPVQSHQ